MLSCFLPVHDALNGPYSHLFLSLFLSVSLYTCYVMPLLIDFAKTWSRHVCPMCVLVTRKVPTLATSTMPTVVTKVCRGRGKKYQVQWQWLKGLLRSSWKKVHMDVFDISGLKLFKNHNFCHYPPPQQ